MTLVPSVTAWHAARLMLAISSLPCHSPFLLLWYIAFWIIVAVFCCKFSWGACILVFCFWSMSCGGWLGGVWIQLFFVPRVVLPLWVLWFIFLGCLSFFVSGGFSALCICWLRGAGGPGGKRAHIICLWLRLWLGFLSLTSWFFGWFLFLGAILGPMFFYSYFFTDDCSNRIIIGNCFSIHDSCNVSSFFVCERLQYKLVNGEYCLQFNLCCYECHTRVS